MEKGISISKKNLIAKLISAADAVKKKYGIDIWFVEIFGKRWSYIAGSIEEEISFLPPERIELDRRFGVVSDGWSKIPAEEKDSLVLSLKESIKTYECS
jgi:hypothetical protein